MAISIMASYRVHVTQCHVAIDYLAVLSIWMRIYMVAHDGVVPTDFQLALHAFECQSLLLTTWIFVC